jgi:hypothetical protein
MTRKHPKARRAVALALFASFLLAASTGAWFNPSTACAETTGGTTPGRSPLPGDPNTPDEGGRSGSTNQQASTDPTPSNWVFVWLESVSHFHFVLR